MTTPTPVDARAFWGTIGQRATGVTVVTASGPNGPAGLIALSATHVTADPPTMLVAIDRRTSALAAVLAAGCFAINYLPRGAEAEAEAFGGRTEAKGADRFAPGRWTTLITGAPTHVEALGVMDCEMEETLERHGVTLVLGRVLAVAAPGAGEPLIYFRGKYRT